MPITDRFERVPLDKIKIDREVRQRREINVDDILPSIKERGVLQPIIIDQNYVLRAGERRYTASVAAGLADIPCRFFEDLDEIEHDIVEYEENAHRSDLTWQENARAVYTIHKKLEAKNEGWTTTKTAERVGLHRTTTGQLIRVGEELAENNPKIAGATTWRAAYNLLTRAADRAATDAIADLLADQNEVPEEMKEETKPLSTGALVVPAAPIAPKMEIPQPIEVANFHEWSANYVGPRFNFLHIDFPYGVDLQDSEQAQSAKWGGYEDAEKVYWDLLESLALNIDRFTSTSAHIMFWFSMDYYTETMAFFEKRIPSFEMQTFPIYWHKTDNKGIMPDPKRQPRRVVETALIGSRGDRLIAQSVSNAYGAPTSKSIHQSEKSRPMLQHFMRMFVDENTRMLDPTCGSGNSLQAATSLGAKQVLGLELDPEFAEAARAAYRKFYILRNMG